MILVYSSFDYLSVVSMQVGGEGPDWHIMLVGFIGTCWMTLAH